MKIAITIISVVLGWVIGQWTMDYIKTERTEAYYQGCKVHVTNPDICLVEAIRFVGAK